MRFLCVYNHIVRKIVRKLLYCHSLLLYHGLVDICSKTVNIQSCLQRSTQMKTTTCSLTIRLFLFSFILIKTFTFNFRNSTCHLYKSCPSGSSHCILRKNFLQLLFKCHLLRLCNWSEIFAHLDNVSSQLNVSHPFILTEILCFRHLFGTLYSPFQFLIHKYFFLVSQSANPASTI